MELTMMARAGLGSSLASGSPGFRVAREGGRDGANEDGEG